MNTRRSTHDLVALDEGYKQLWCIGGNDGSNSLGTIEVYNIANNTWTKGQAMSLRRTSLAACSLFCNQIRTEPVKLANNKITVCVDESAAMLGDKKDL